MSYNFNVKLATAKYTVEIDTAAQYGYFENNTTGAGGGLWFDGKELTDYDGVFELPKEVITASINAGFDMTYVME